MRAKNLLVAFVLGVALAAGAWTAITLNERAAALQTARALPEPVEIASFELLDQTGTTIGREVFRGQWDLVFFGFTNCPDICPLTLQTLATARRQLAEAGHSPLPRIVLVSVDPERDTPERMAQYVGAFGDDNLGITGEIEELRKLTASLGIYFQKQPGEHYSVDHSAVVIVLNPEGRFSALFSAPHVAGNFVHDMPRLMSR